MLPYTLPPFSFNLNEFIWDLTIKSSFFVCIHSFFPYILIFHSALIIHCSVCFVSFLQPHWFSLPHKIDALNPVSHLSKTHSYLHYVAVTWASDCMFPLYSYVLVLVQVLWLVARDTNQENQIACHKSYTMYASPFLFVKNISLPLSDSKSTVHST